MSKHYPKLSKILQRLLFERKMKPVDLARELHMPQPTIHRLVVGKSTRPYRSSLEPIAEFFSLSVDQLLGEEALADEAGQDKLPEKAKKFRQIPVVEWEAAADLIDGQQEIHDEKAYIMANPALSDKAFAVVMHDSSMEPVFPKGSTLVFDPMETAKDRNYILVKLKDAKAPIFRQLLIDGEDKYLKPLNPDLSNFKMRILEDEDIIVAVLIEARTSFH